MAPGVSIDRSASVCNAPVEDFIHRRQLYNLRSNINRARTHVNNTWSRQEEDRLQASRWNAKRRQNTHDTHAEIERENMRLMLRFQEMEKASVRKSSSVPTIKCSKTPAGSNIGARNKELSRIEAENRRLLQRLRSTKASVSVSKLAEEHRRTEKVMHMRLEFPSSVLANVNQERPQRAIGSRVAMPKSGKDGGDLCSVRLPAVYPSSVLAAAMITEADVKAEMDRPFSGDSAGSSCMMPAAPAAVDGCLQDADVEDDENENAVSAAKHDFEELRLGLNLGVGMPSQSRLLANRLLEAEAAERQAAAEAAAAKDAAEKAMRDAEAMDAEEDAMLGYDNVVKWYNDEAHSGKPLPSAAQDARRAALLAEVRSGIDQVVTPLNFGF